MRWSTVLEVFEQFLREFLTLKTSRMLYYDGHTRIVGKNEIALQDDAKPASTTLTGFGFVQRKDLKSVPLTGYGSPSPFFSS